MFSYIELIYFYYFMVTLLIFYHKLVRKNRMLPIRTPQCLLLSLQAANYRVFGGTRDTSRHKTKTIYSVRFSLLKTVTMSDK